MGFVSEASLTPKAHHLSDTEIQRLLTALDNLIARNPGKTYLRPIVLFALNTGIRIKSICGLEWRDIIRLDDDGGELQLRAANIKTRKAVNLPLSSAAAVILRLLGGGADDERVFANFTVSHINKAIKDLMVSAGLEKYSAYSRRHNYAT